MFMHFTGGGIGHLSTQELMQGFEGEIQGLWGSVAVPALTDNSDSDDSDKDLDLNVQVIDATDDGVDSNPESNSELLDTEDAAFISHEDETFLGEEVDSDT
jgi:hypothetical protein